MTFEHGRISTWRLPRFSAFEMDLRQSARTCGEKGERSVLSCCVSCVCDASASSAAAPGLQLCRAAAASAAAAGLQPLTGPRGPAGGRRNSRELPARSRDRFSGRPCTSGAATAYIRGLGAPRPRFAALRELQRAMPKTAYAIAAAGNFDAVANAHSNHDCWRAVCRLRCSLGGDIRGAFTRQAIA
jgi:hypothetical protein